jgi:hypothetical protein
VCSHAVRCEKRRAAAGRVMCVVRLRSERVEMFSDVVMLEASL